MGQNWLGHRFFPPKANGTVYCAFSPSACKGFGFVINMEAANSTQLSHKAGVVGCVEGV